MLTEKTIKFNYTLSPFSLLYRMGVAFRNQLFNWGLLSSESYSIPVICVGNLAAGGTGKTPHIEYLVRLLTPKYKIAVLSRGYKRKTSGYVLAKPESTSRELGDESFQIKRKFPHILVAVDSNRRRGIKNLLALPEDTRPDVILLDDAFQHRYVIPSLSILLTDYNRLYYRDKLLPVGRLREPSSAIRRADMVIVTKCDEDLKPIDFRIIENEMNLLAHQDLFFTHVTYGEIEPVFPEAPSHVLRDIRKEDDVLVLSGIAAPEHFINEAKKYSDKVVSMSFPDHHSFSRKDIGRIKSIYNKMASPEKIILVTEKDAARIINNPFIPIDWKPKIYMLPIKVEFSAKGNTLFDEIIERHIITMQRNSILR